VIAAVGVNATVGVSPLQLNLNGLVLQKIAQAEMKIGGTFARMPVAAIDLRCLALAV
jgi:hypothetical protein